MYCIAFDTKGYIKDYSCFTSLHNCDEILNHICNTYILFCQVTSISKLVKRKSNENMIDSYTIVTLFPRCQ